MKFLITYIILFLSLQCFSKSLKIGLIADIQYANKPARAEREYNLSADKLKYAVSVFNKKNVDFVQTLGDMVDAGRENYDSILPIFDVLNAPAYHLIGNHDKYIDENLTLLLPIPDNYYSFFYENWLFIVLDATDLLIGYRGAIMEKQLSWLKNELEKSIKNDRKVIIFSHMPFLTDKNNYCLINNYEVLKTIKSYENVKMVISGHNHSGSYIYKNCIHHLTLKAMVDTKNNSFSILKLKKNKVKLKGYGNQNDYKFTL